jgi:hypothetical protein
MTGPGITPGSRRGPAPDLSLVTYSGDQGYNHLPFLVHLTCSAFSAILSIGTVVQRHATLSKNLLLVALHLTEAGLIVRGGVDHARKKSFPDSLFFLCRHRQHVDLPKEA